MCSFDFDLNGPGLPDIGMCVLSVCSSVCFALLSFFAISKELVLWTFLLPCSNRASVGTFHIFHMAFLVH